MQTERSNISITNMEDGTENYVVQCNDCGATVMNGKAKDIKHYNTCTPTPTDVEYFNTDMSEIEEAELCLKQ